MSTIPKKIHWCWLSGDPLPQKIQRCINSWKNVMPDYEIICWDTNRFDIHSVKFVEQACMCKKWAYAADYIRLYALYTEGGIYLDSDVMVFKKFDKFLHHSAFSSIEYIPEIVSWRNTWRDDYYYDQYAGYGIQAAIIGGEKGHPWMKECMEYYENNEFVPKNNGFVLKNSVINMELSPMLLARCANRSYEFQYDVFSIKPQILKNGIVIYPSSVLSSLWGKMNLSTYTIHLAEQAWIEGLSEKRALESSIKKYYERLCGSNRFFGMTHYWRKQLLKYTKQLLTIKK